MSACAITRPQLAVELPTDLPPLPICVAPFTEFPSNYRTERSRRAPLCKPQCAEIVLHIDHDQCSAASLDRIVGQQLAHPAHDTVLHERGDDVVVHEKPSRNKAVAEATVALIRFQSG